MANYEEQTQLTDVRSGQNCAICMVPGKKREHLCESWPFRAHGYMVELLDQPTEETRQTHRKLVQRAAVHRERVWHKYEDEWRSFHLGISTGRQ